VSAKPGLIFQHGSAGPPARVGEWLDERGVAYVVHHAGADPSVRVADYSFMVTLGSQHSASAAEPAWVPEEITALREAVDTGVPVLGLCFGGQALSLALGGGVDALVKPEIGWFALEAVDDAVPAGPWLMMHTEQMRVPPGAVELARSPAGPAAFARGPHLGVQFHPEVDVERVAVWARADPGLAKVGLTPEELVAQSEQHAPAAREQAFAMFDRWIAGALNGGGAATSDAS
jgi:GMP synthase-like glutamine amidotransferase